MKPNWNQFKVNWNQFKVNWNQFKINWNQLKVIWNQLKVNCNQFKVNWNQLKVNWNQLKVNWNQLKSTNFFWFHTIACPIPCSRMRSKGSRFTLGVWGLRVCSLDVAFVVATVRNRPQPFATVRVRTVWPCLWEVLQRWSFLEVSDVWLLRFAWQAWHFVTFRRVSQRVENRFAWQAQYFCDVFRRCVAVFVAGAALWTRPSSFFVAGAAL